MPREILSLREFPTPRQHVRHIFVQFIPHIRHMNVKFHSLFQFVFGGIIWLETSVGTINSCVAAAIIKGRVLLSIFSQFPLPFLFYQCVTKSFLLCFGKSGLLSLILPISSPSSVVALGLGCCKINVRVKCSSEAHFSASLMIE